MSYLLLLIESLNLTCYVLRYILFLDIAAFCVVAVESVGRQIPMAFLERVKDDFNKRYGGGKAATAQAKSLNKDFG